MEGQDRTGLRDLRRTSDIVFLSPGGFRGNSKWLYIALSKSPDLRDRLLWLAMTADESDELQASGVHSHVWSEDWGHNDTWKAIRNCKIVIASDVFHAHPAFEFIREFSLKATLLQLWHGRPAKNVGEDFIQTPSDMKHFSDHARELGMDVIMLCPNETLLDEYVQFFPNYTFVVLPEPKFLSISEESRSPLSHIGVDDQAIELLESDELTVLIIPTYTEVQPTDFVEVVAGWEKSMSVKSMKAVLKFHHHQSELPPQLFPGRKIGCIFIAESDSDVYPLIASAPKIITDFGSIALEVQELGLRGVVTDLFGQDSRGNRSPTQAILDLKPSILAASLEKALDHEIPASDFQNNLEPDEMLTLWKDYIVELLSI